LIQNGGVTFHPLRLDAEDFWLISNGNVSFAQNINMTSDIFMPVDLSESMVAAVEEFSFLQDDEKRIHIPLVPYSGPINSIKTFP